MDELPPQPIDVTMTPALSTPRRGIPRRVIVGLGLVAAVIAVFSTVLAIVYTRPLSDSIVHTLGTRLPLPAAVVDDEWISLRAFFTERDALRVYFTSLGDTAQAPSEEELTQNILDTLIRKTAVEQLAARYQLSLDAARVDEFYQEMLGGTEESAFATQLQDSFGWSPDEFRIRIVQPVVLATQVSEDILAKPEHQLVAKEKIEAALARVNAGEEFAIVAGETSGNLESGNSGELGVIALSELPPDWVVFLEALEVGQHTAVVDGPEDYFVFQVTDRIIVEDDVKLGLSAIVVPKITLESVVDAYLEEVRVWRLVGRKST